LPRQITEPVSEGKCGKIISWECECAFCYQLFAAGALWIWISHNWLKLAFLLFKEQVPFKFEINMSAIQCQMKAYRLIPLYTPVKSHLTIPLGKKIAKNGIINTFRQFDDTGHLSAYWGLQSQPNPYATGNCF
jgi:hypothetical protein